MFQSTLVVPFVMFLTTREVFVNVMILGGVNQENKYARACLERANKKFSEVFMTIGECVAASSWKLMEHTL